MVSSGILGLALTCISVVAPETASAPLVAAAPKAARRAGPAPLGATLNGPAREDYEAAKVLFEAGDFAGARLKFQAAYDQQPDPRLLWNMAVCEKNLRRYALVRELTERFLRDAGAARLLSERERGEAQALLETIAKFRSTLRVEVDQAGAEIVLDGTVVASTPMSAPVDIEIGQHVLEIRKPGFRSVRLERNESGGSEWFVQTHLEPQVARLKVKAPPEAKVSLVDRPLGQGTVDTSVPPGRYLLRVTAPDKLPYEVEISLEDQETREVTPPELRDAAGSSRAWLWVLSGAAAVVAAGVASYFLFRPTEQPLVEDGFDVIQLEQRWR